MRKKITYFSLYIIFSFQLFAEGSVSGKVFYNYTTSLDTSGSNAFNMKRAYLTFANNINEAVYYKVTYDMGNNDGGSAHTAFLKVASVTWKTSFGDMSIGMLGMNMFKTMENTWGHRFIQKMPMDTYGFSPSADLGIGISRKFGSISTKTLLTNGVGYKKIENDKYKKFSTHFVYGEPQLNKMDGFNIGSSLSIEPYDDINNIKKNSLVTGFFIGFGGSGFRGGGEFDTKQKDDITSQIICAYGTYKVSKNLSLLIRVDQVDRDTSINQDETIALVAGAHYTIDKGLIVAPTFRMTTPEKGNAENKIIVNLQFSF
tara:strand:- start:482 stop:1426 length:945 start_codon:yes stop_codon:yes gene_type:complete